MTLVQLKHLIELASRGSFSQSASKLFITQPALSRSIKALEDELGQSLFDRIGRKNKLTHFGQHFVQRARGWWMRPMSCARPARSSRRATLASSGWAWAPGQAAMLMTRLLMLMATRHPQAHIDISRGTTTLLVLALRDRVLDALILDSRSLQPCADLKVEAVHEMSGTFMCRPGHPLAQHRSVTFAMLSGYPIASTP